MCLWFRKEDIGALGRLLLRGLFGVWTVRRERHKVKDFMRFKPSQRQIYLFEKGIVFCKIRMEPSDQGLSPHYSFKKSMKVNESVPLHLAVSTPYGEEYNHPYFTDGRL